MNPVIEGPETRATETVERFVPAHERIIPVCDMVTDGFAVNRVIIPHMGVTLVCLEYVVPPIGVILNVYEVPLLNPDEIVAFVPEYVTGELNPVIEGPETRATETVVRLVPVHERTIPVPGVYTDVNEVIVPHVVVTVGCVEYVVPPIGVILNVYEDPLVNPDEIVAVVPEYV